MQFKDICDVLVSIEAKFDVEAIRVKDICIWPLIRQTLWFALSQKDIISTKSTNVNVTKFNFFVRQLKSWPNKLKQLKQHFQLNKKSSDEIEIAIFSRQVYLQSIEGNLVYDRIVDPLVAILESFSRVKKYYLGGVELQKDMAYSANALFESKLVKNDALPPDIISIVVKIAEHAKLNQASFIDKFINNYRLFNKWAKTGDKLFSSHPTIKTIYLTSWYFPDMMGLVFAARKRDITVVDVQHGQQGKFQGLYSWWTRVPKNGYLLMPNKFWCWGQKSIDNITQSGHKNMHDMPFLGGYPWMEFYQNKFSKLNKTAGEGNAESKTILFTLQAPDGDHKEVIPDFVLKFLKSSLSNDIKFIFRCHPNYHGCTQYITQRLESVRKNKYLVSTGKKALYDDMLLATHHLTACSTCCYEADAFGIPTMLFGTDALTIYQEEIKSKIFFWTDGRLEDIITWVKIDKNTQPNSGYIISSLGLAREMLNLNSHTS